MCMSTKCIGFDSGFEVGHKQLGNAVHHIYFGFMIKMY